MKIIFTLCFVAFLHLSNYAQSEINSSDSSKVFTFVEVMPEFPGGNDSMYKFIFQNTIYPNAALHQRIEGKVIVQFIVNEDGSVSNAIVKKSAHPLLDAEALRVVNLFLNFKPGTQQGKSVKVYFMLPFNFKLSDPKPSEKK
jgi:protein TonB